MPLHEFNSSGVLRNKENNREIDPQSVSSNSPIKQSNHHNKNSPTKKIISTQINQLKIKLSDRQFELKKLQQDCSVKLALMQKQLTKQKNQKKQIQKQWKQKLDQDKHYYETKIIMIEQQWKLKVQLNRNQVKKQEKFILQQQKKILTEHYQKLIKELKDQLELNKQQNNRQQSTLKLEHQSFVNSLNSKYKAQIQQIYTKHEADISQLKQIHLSEVQFYHQLEDQKTKQQNVISKILSDKIRGLQQEIRNLKNHINQLNLQIQTKSQQILNQKRQKQEYRLDKICLQRKLSRLQPDLKQQNQKDLSQAQKLYQQKLSQQVNLFNDRINNLTKLYSQSKESYQVRIAQLQQRCKQISTLHASIKSNQQDLKKIETLEMKLIRREMELQKQKEDAKMCKLQLSNMDQVLQKMFEEAKVKSLKTRKHRLPSLLSSGQNRSTMDCYVHSGQSVKQPKKFSIREMNYHSISKVKQNIDLGMYQ